jgi:hypothetical protein
MEILGFRVSFPRLPLPVRPLSFLPLAIAGALLAGTPVDAGPQPRDDIYPNSQAASAAAGSLGCSGAHAVASGFRPCTDADSYRKARLEHESGHHMGH